MALSDSGDVRDEDLFGAIDAYIERLFVAEDDALQGALEDSQSAGLPGIHISATQGKFLHLLARLVRARRILEIGTLGGYSTIWLARALPEGGKLITLEYSARHAEVAQRNLERAGVAERVEVIVGAALESLPRLQERGEEPFQMIFIDADKQGYPAYLDWAWKLSEAGTLIVADNVVREGKVMAPAEDDPATQGAARFNELLAAHPAMDATVMQMVGAKSHDGLALAIVRQGP